MDLKELHEKVLYPVVRVRSGNAGGSGTVIYSAPSGDEHVNLVLTNYHVIENAISYRDDWDSVIKKQVKKEFLNPVHVEIFDYAALSNVVSANEHQAQIIAYDKHDDLAVIKMDRPIPLSYVAALIPESSIPSIKLFTPLWLCGCSLLHEPFANPGHVTYMKELIENKLYYMANAPSYFGNSGGAVFLGDSGHFIGVPSRVSSMQLGFGVDIVTWMGFFVTPQRIYEFLRAQELHFIWDNTDSFEKAMERRKQKQRKALAHILAEQSSRGQEDAGLYG